MAIRRRLFAFLAHLRITSYNVCYTKLLRIARRAGREIGKLGCDSFSQDKGTSFFEPCHRFGFIALKFFRGQSAACLRGKAICMKDIFDSNRHPIEGWAVLGIGKLDYEFVCLPV